MQPEIISRNIDLHTSGRVSHRGISICKTVVSGMQRVSVYGMQGGHRVWSIIMKDAFLFLYSGITYNPQ